MSTQDQDLSLQLDVLEAAGCGRVFEDRASAAQADRAGLRAALDYVRDGEVLVVWKLDRLGRSLPHLIETVTELAEHRSPFASVRSPGQHRPSSLCRSRAASVRVLRLFANR